MRRPSAVLRQVNLLLNIMGHSPPWPLLLLGLFMGPGASTEDAAPVVVTGTLGASVILPLQLLSGQQVESISWTSRSVPTAFAKVTLVDAGGPDTFYQAETRYQSRVSVVGPDHSLQISNLSREDAGPYRAHINLRGSHITHTQEYSLRVYGGSKNALPRMRLAAAPASACVLCVDICKAAGHQVEPLPKGEQLAQPRVTVSSRRGENGDCIIILTCAAESRGATVTYSWMPLRPSTVVSRGGSVLSVSLRPEDSALTFTCTVKNPVSNSSSLPVPVSHLCAGPGTLRGDIVGELMISTLGESATLPLEVPAGQEATEVIWSSPGLLAVLRPGPAGKPVLVAETQGPYSGRLSVPHRSFSLQISPLWLQDSGLYTAWITLRSPPVNITKDFTLRVYERLQEPNITVSSRIVRDGTCFITLACFLEWAGEDVQYSWDPHGQGAVVSHGGTTLSTSWRSGDSDSYRCTTRNPISQSSHSIPTQPLCSASILLCSLRKEFLLFLILGALGIEWI